MADQMTCDEVVYHGYQPTGGGAAVVAIEDLAGETIGLLRHHVKHSPTGFQWGYEGSGPAETARCLLLDAVRDPRCPSCAGTHKVILDGETERPLNPEVDDPACELAAPCWDCDPDGLRNLPYQSFKREFVAAWGSEWRMPRVEVRRWLTAIGVEI